MVTGGPVKGFVLTEVAVCVVCARALCCVPWDYGLTAPFGTKTSLDAPEFE